MTSTGYAHTGATRRIRAATGGRFRAPQWAPGRQLWRPFPSRLAPPARNPRRHRARLVRVQSDTGGTDRACPVDKTAPDRTHSAAATISARQPHQAGRSDPGRAGPGGGTIAPVARPFARHARTNVTSHTFPHRAAAPLASFHTRFGGAMPRSGPGRASRGDGSLPACSTAPTASRHFTPPLPGARPARHFTHAPPRAEAPSQRHFTHAEAAVKPGTGASAADAARRPRRNPPQARYPRHPTHAQPASNRVAARAARCRGEAPRAHPSRRALQTAFHTRVPGIRHQRHFTHAAGRNGSARHRTAPIVRSRPALSIVTRHTVLPYACRSYRAGNRAAAGYPCPAAEELSEARHFTHGPPVPRPQPLREGRCAWSTSAPASAGTGPAASFRTRTRRCRPRVTSPTVRLIHARSRCE